MTLDEIRIIAADGISLHVDLWRPEAPPTFAVMMAHGGGEHLRRHTWLGERVAAAGGIAFGPDHRGQGRSGGKRGDVDAFETYAADLRRVHDEVMAGLGDIPLLLFGHSMGGLITLTFLLEHRGLEIRGAVISAPLLGLTMKVSPFKEMLGRVAARVAPGLSLPAGIPDEMISRDPEVVAAYASDPDRARVVTARFFSAMNRAIERVQVEAATLTTPMLWYVGTADGICDPVQTREVFASMTGAAKHDQRIEVFDGYYHELHNEPAELRAPIHDLVLGWIGERV